MTTCRLLLASSSRTHGTGYLDHCAAEIADLLGRVGRVLFVPFALHDHAAYADVARTRFAAMGYGVDSLHEAGSDPAAAARAVERAEAMFIGGGNTFRLLKALYDRDLLPPIRARVAAGMPYLGASAGSNVACATIGTTNDMPIVEPPSFAALALVPFNLNPHYLDPEPGSTHQGETREQRIRQYLEENDRRVVGLREGGMLRVEGDRMTLKGTAGARLFARGREPEEFAPGVRLDFLLAG
jgi:dipeptidase E